MYLPKLDSTPIDLDQPLSPEDRDFVLMMFKQIPEKSLRQIASIGFRTFSNEAEALELGKKARKIIMDSHK